MTKEEAINKVRQMNLPKETMEILQALAPDLRESEDERVRKAIIKSIEEDSSVYEQEVSKEQMLAYLEKQKPMYNLEIPAGDVAPAEEDGPFDEDEFLENELSAFLQNYDKGYADDAAVSDVAKHFYEIGKKQKEKPNSADSFTDGIIEVRSFQRGMEVGKRLKQREQKPAQTSEEKEYIRTLKSLISDFIRDKQPEDVVFYQKIYDWLDGRHVEQKPNIELIQQSWYMEGYHDREFGKEPKWILKTGEGGPKHELNPRYGEPLSTKQKPVEWSEDEERLINTSISFLKDFADKGYENAVECIDWLKSKLNGSTCK